MIEVNKLFRIVYGVAGDPDNIQRRPLSRGKPLASSRGRVKDNYKRLKRRRKYPLEESWRVEDDDVARPGTTYSATINPAGCISDP